MSRVKSYFPEKVPGGESSVIGRHWVICGRLDLWNFTSAGFRSPYFLMPSMNLPSLSNASECFARIASRSLVASASPNSHISRQRLSTSLEPSQDATISPQNLVRRCHSCQEAISARITANASVVLFFYALLLKKGLRKTRSQLYKYPNITNGRSQG